MPSRPRCSSAFWTRHPGPWSSRRGLAPVGDPGSAARASPGLATPTQVTSAANSARAGKIGAADFLLMPLYVRILPNVARWRSRSHAPAEQVATQVVGPENGERLGPVGPFTGGHVPPP